MENKIIDEANYGGRGRKKILFYFIIEETFFFFFYFGAVPQFLRIPR